MGAAEFSIEGRPVGGGAPCLVIGEVALAHDGSLGMAHAYIDAAARAGADAVKFQTHIAAAESTPAEPFRVSLSGQDRTRYEYWRRTEFSEEQWRTLARHARERGLAFLSSPFSMEAVELLERVRVGAWKIPSGEITNTPMLERIGKTALPVLLSTGMSALAEIDRTVEDLRRRGSAFAVLQATSIYPCPPEQLGLNLIPLYRQRYGVPVGLSDHSGTVYAGLAAAALQIDLLEVHVCLSREMFGPDVPASVTTAELQTLIEGIRFIERARSHLVDKDGQAGELAEVRRVFMKSLVARRDLPAGTLLSEDDLAAKKPATGIPVSRLREVAGRRLRREVKADEPLTPDDLI